jgi:glycosyltransferase involved in cell wall biosynthesis
MGIQSTTALGYDFNSQLNKLLSEKAEVYVGHQEMSMALAKELILQGKTVAFDFEDWHSRDLLPKDRVYRPTKLLERLEKYVLENAAYCYTTSEAMAVAMSSYHQVPKPLVIYNCFFVAQRDMIDQQNKDRQHNETPSVYWFSQVISKGRGLELLFDALPFVKNALQLHLRGSIDSRYQSELQDKTPKHIELHIHDLVLPDELISRIAEHDLGIGFEESQPENKNYTVSNKIFHYLQSGIPILATETAGQIEIAQKAPEAITIVKRNPIDIAENLDTILSDVVRLNLRKEASWIAGKELYAFENQASRLIRMLDENLNI